MSLVDVWQSYLTLQKGEHAALPRFRFPPAVSRSLRAQKGQRVVLIDSGRVSDLELLARAIEAKESLLGRTYDLPAIWLDVSLKGRHTEYPALRRYTIGLALRYPFAFLRVLASTRSLGCAIIGVYRQWIHGTGIANLELFSSNSRFIECLRIAAALEGITVTEFLHGISSDVFGQFYAMLDKIAEQAGAELIYVNMLPSLPQPEAVERKLLREHGAQAFFVNEKPWRAYDPVLRHDVLIVGGDIIDGDYLETPYFASEVAAILACRAAGHSVVYCPHPAQRARVPQHLPADTAIGSVADFANSSTVLLGHYSTVLFNAKIMGYRVLIFPDAWPQIPENLAALFADCAASTYSLEGLEEIVCASAGLAKLKLGPVGVDLGKDHSF